MKNNSFLQSLFSSKIMILLCLLTIGSTAWAQWTDPISGVTFTPISGTGSHSFTDNEGAAKACDGNAGTKMGSNASSFPVNVVIQASSAVKISGYSITTANDNATYTNRNPKNWTVSGSNDNSTWTTIATVSNDAILKDVNNKTYFFSCTSSQAYTYFKFEVTANQGNGYMQFSEFHPLVSVPTSSTANGYVIFASNRYLPNTTTATTTFSPSTCLWTLTSNKLMNGDNYLRTNSDEDEIRISTNNTRNGIALSGTESGTTGQTIKINNSLYLRYNSGWTGTTNSSDATACLFAVTKNTYSESVINPAFSGADQFSDSEVGTTKNYTITTNASYRLGFINYVFYNNTDHFFKSDNSTRITTPPAAEGITYTWELSSNAAGHVSVNTSGAVTYNTVFEEDTYVTLTLKATSNTSNHVFTSATKTILFEAPRVDPTGVTASNLTLYVGNSQPANVTLTPNPCYRNLEFTSSNTGIATVTNAGVVTGVAVGTTTVNVKAYKIGNTDYLSTTFNVTVKDKVATPVISYEPNNSNDGATATTTLTCATSGATIYYTTNGDEPTTSSTPYTTTFTVNNNQTVKAIAVKNVTGWDNSDIATLTYVKRVLPTPTIEMSNGSVTFTCTEPGVTFHYTTNGTTPTASSTAWTGPTAITGLTNECTIKVIATKSGWIKSAVASRQYIMASGASGSVVTLNDYEDHNWSYYSGAAIGNYNTKTDYKGKLYSPNPRNIKITYLGKGQMRTGNDASSLTAVPETMRVSVGLGDESENTFVYYKTLERNANNRYEYTTIPNPFQVRPTNASDATTKWRGFQSWRIKSISGGSIYAATTGGTALAVGSMLNAETAYYFVPDDANGTGYTPNCTSMSIELEAVWARAEVSTNGTFSSGYNSVERNFYIVSNSTTNNMPASSYPCTYSSFYPNGATSATGTTLASLSNRATRRGSFTAKKDSKIENICLNNYNDTSKIDGTGHNLTIGRGVSNSNGTGLCATDIFGFQFIPETGKGTQNNQSRSEQNFTIRIESGKYTNCHLFSNADKASSGTTNHRPVFSGTNTVRATLGCDYDRADNTNNNLTITSNLWMGEGCYFSTPANLTDGYFKCWTKSGNLLTTTLNEGTGGIESFYIGTSGNQSSSSSDASRYIPPRFLYVEGGILDGIAGGLDDTYYTDTTLMRVYVKMTGGTVRGCVYGAGSFAIAAGRRNFIFLGGEVGGWIAAGCNGIGGSTTSSNNGAMNGTTFLYIGGNTKVGYKNTSVNSVEGGNIFGAGRGAPVDDYPVGTVNNSNIVIADNAKIEKNVYGGGNYGYTDGNANIYILGGTVDGKVFGGSNLKKGKTPTIYMDGGLVKGGIYGGSNTEGIISESVTIQINGGQVGADAAHTGNVHGGGYGDATGITKNVDITIGTSSATDSVTIYGDVYGGSALGSVNGTSAANTYHTNVTLNKGIIYGSLYGGGLGDASHQANVYGPVTVTINGGKLCSTTQGGLGAVFGCNNTNGRPRRKVLVNVTGGEMEYIYGGGNAAPYTVLTPNSFDNFHVWMSGGRVHKHVFGGGLGANAIITGNTEVRITGPSVIEGNVYGGGNAGTVTGNTNVQIGTK